MKIYQVLVYGVSTKEYVERPFLYMMSPEDEPLVELVASSTPVKARALVFNKHDLWPKSNGEFPGVLVLTVGTQDVAEGIITDTAPSEWWGDA